jgi:hypothetical protein
VPERALALAVWDSLVSPAVRIRNRWLSGESRVKQRLQPRGFGGEDGEGGE